MFIDNFDLLNMFPIHTLAIHQKLEVIKFNQKYQNKLYPHRTKPKMKIPFECFATYLLNLLFAITTTTLITLPRILMKWNGFFRPVLLCHQYNIMKKQRKWEFGERRWFYGIWMKYIQENEPVSNPRNTNPILLSA